MTHVDVLLPTCDREASLVMTLAGLAAQDERDFHLVISDQGRTPVREQPVVRSLLRVIEARGGTIEWHGRERRGIAEQRDFLLGRASAPFVLFLDDDVFMDRWVLGELLHTINEERCGFVGAFPSGLSFRDDVRPEQQRIEYWDGPVAPEVVEPDAPAWERWHLHRAANLWHIAQQLPPSGPPRRYKVAWIACCILYDRQKLLEVGGFSFWERLPRFHSGEEVLVQNLLMRRWGGCGIVPSGTYHSELPSTVLNPAGAVDGHALNLLPELVARFAPGSVNDPEPQGSPARA